jgi:hypothetical protein
MSEAPLYLGAESVVGLAEGPREQLRRLCLLQGEKEVCLSATDRFRARRGKIF